MTFLKNPENDGSQVIVVGGHARGDLARLAVSEVNSTAKPAKRNELRFMADRTHAVFHEIKSHSVRFQRHRVRRRELQGSSRDFVGVKYAARERKLRR